MKYRRIGLYGISSTGKTTVAKLIEQIHPQYKFIDGSDVFNKICPDGLSGFKKLSIKEKTKYRHLAIDFLVDLQKTLQKHLIIAGHYSFISKDNSLEIAWTEADENFYTDIFVFEDTPERIYQRNLQRGINYSKVQIKKWQDFEVSQIAKLQNQIIYFNTEESINKLALFVLREINKSLILGELNGFIEETRAETYLLFDADGTIIPCDSSTIVSKYLNKSSPEIIKQLFKKYEDYCFNAFLDVATHYYEVNNSEIWKNAMLQASKEITLNQEFIKLLRTPSVGKIIISAGFNDLWKNIAVKYNFSGVKVIAGNSLFDSYIITDENKGEIVDLLKKNNKKVISFGDSLVDKQMLIKSDLGIYVVYDRIKSIYKHLVNKKNIEYISFNKELHPNNIPQTDVHQVIANLNMD